VRSLDEAKRFTSQNGYPIIIKAINGGMSNVSRVSSVCKHLNRWWKGNAGSSK
jgi:pyruvate carboxylase